jgi:hypothetical protein
MTTITPQQKAELDAKIAQVKAARAASSAAPAVDPQGSQAPQGLSAEQKAALDAMVQKTKDSRPKEEPGLMKKVGGAIVGFGKSLAQPFVKTAVTGAAAIEGTARALSGDLEGADRVAMEGYNVPGFGQVKPAKIASDIEIKKDAKGNEYMTGGKFGRETLKTIGTGAEIASVLAGGGEVGAAVKGAGSFAGKTVAKKIAQGAVEGAATGAMQGFGSEAQKDNATAGDIATSTVGGAALGGAFGAAVPAAGSAYRGARQAITKGTEVAQDVAGKAGERLKTVFGKKTLGEAEEAALMAKGAPDARVATKAMDDAGRIVTDKEAAEVVRQGIPEADVALIKSGSKADKEKMLRMLDIREGQLTNKALTARATDEVGDTFVEHLAKPIETLNKEAGKKLDTVARGLAGKKIDPADAVAQLGTDLESAGVSVNSKGKLVFKGSNFEGLKGAQTLINNVWNRVQRVAKTGDALQAHRLKAYIDEIVNYGKQAEGLSGRAEGILKNFRHNIDAILDVNFPQYNKVNTVYSETIKQLDNMASAIGRKFKVGDSFADAQAGIAMRRILSNAQSRSEILRLIQGMQGVAKKYGIKVDHDIITQANFADVLEKMLGSEAPTSFLGQGERFLNQAEEGIGALSEFGKGNVLKGTIKAGKYAIDITRGISQDNKIKALRALLERDIGKLPKKAFGKAVKK